MGAQGRAALKLFFETGDIPTEAQFADLIDSNQNITDDGLAITGNGTQFALPYYATVSTLGNSSLRQNFATGHIEIAAGKAFRDATLTSNILYLNDGTGGVSMTISGLVYDNSYIGMWDHSIELVAGTSDGAATVLWLQAMQQDTTVKNSISIHSDENVAANSLNQYISETLHKFRIGATSITEITSTGLVIKNGMMINYTPSSDKDVTLLNLSTISNTPKQIWDESRNAFVFSSTTSGAISIQGTSGQNLSLNFYQSATEKGRLQYDNSKNAMSLIVGAGMGAIVMDWINDGNIVLHNRGETGTIPAAGTLNFWAEDAVGAGTNAFHSMTEDNNEIVLYPFGTYTRNAAIVEDRTLLASANATTLNNNNVLAAMIADLQSIGIIN